MIVKIFGPPGTGKTRSLLRVVEKALLSGIPANRIGYVTFSVRGRIEAVQRANDVLGLSGSQLAYFKTLHSLAYRQLGLTRDTLISRPEQLREFGVFMGLEFPSHMKASLDDDAPLHLDDTVEGGQLLAFDHYARQLCVTHDHAAKTWKGAHDMDARRARRFSVAYREWKHEHGLFDFTDLLECDVKPLDVDVMIVDEAQDLSPLQWTLFDRLAASAGRTYIAGDDDQAIYQWAGASPDAFVARKADHEIVLNQSFRVPQSIQYVANRLIQPVKGRKVKKWHPRESAHGAVRYYGDTDTISPLIRPNEDTLVLFRTHYVGAAIETELRQMGVPYAYANGETPWAFRAISAIHALHRLQTGGLVLNGHLCELIKFIAMPDRERRRQLDAIFERDEHYVWRVSEAAAVIGAAVHAHWSKAFTKLSRHDLDYLLAIERHSGVDAMFRPPLVRMSTIHSAKGAQADHVILYTHLTGKVREALEEDPDAERRVFYVAVTRARERLSVVGIDNPLFI